MQMSTRGAGLASQRGQRSAWIRPLVAATLPARAVTCLSRSGATSQATRAVQGGTLFLNGVHKAGTSCRSVVCRYQEDGQDDISDTVGGETTELRVIVVTSGKGGVGKTTTTANLGMSIARLGHRVCLIDADIGLRNLDLLLGLENRILYTAIDILDGECRLDQALIRDKRWKNLSLLSMSRNRQRFNITRAHMVQLCEALQALGFNFIILDCPAGIDVGFINAISPAKEAVLVTTPEITSIRDADRVAGLLEANGIFNVKLLVNRVRPEMVQTSDMMSVKDVQEMLGIPLLGAIPEDEKVIVATNKGEPLVLHKQMSLSGVALENAARRLIGKQDYFVDMDSNNNKTFFQRVGEGLFGRS